jgi:superfamily II DNA or RNA helicase
MLRGTPNVKATRPKHHRTRYFVSGGLFDGLESFADLEARIAALPTEKDRGDALEVFAEAYLTTQKIVEAEAVWPDDQVPISVLRECRLQLKDMGADGVYKTWSGQYNAYQSKFRTGRPALTWQELSTFMGLTDQVGERVLFTNCDDLSPVMDDRSGFFCIRGNDLDRLTKDDLEAIANWLHGAVFTPKRKNPLPHQVKALEDILIGLKDNDRVTAVMACGTGKTLVALWLAEQRKAKRILVLLPSLALVRQTLHEWIKETLWERLRFIAVCSDPTVVRGVDPLIVHQKDLDFGVKNDVREVYEFLVAPGDGIRIVFSTYQSAHLVGEAARQIGAFDLAVFDEAHKTAGREDANFGFALEDRNLAAARRVFLTATPRHYDVRFRTRNKEGDKALVYSMDQPATYGPIVHTLTFAEAAKRGIICNYKIIISIVTSDMINADLLSTGEVLVEGDVIRARTVANQIAIQKACEKHDLKKIFSFHRSVASAKDFTGDTTSSIKTHLPQYEAYHVNGEMQTARREMEMRAFREADRAIMSNARCLTEGVDVPAVDVVAFLSPRKSKVDIVQAAGRAMRKADGKQTGYVLLPLFLETQENESLEDALARTDFEEAWDVLQAMQEQDAVLADIIRDMREEMGRRGGFDDSRLRERVEVLAPEVSLEVLRTAVSTALVDRLGTTWGERYGELQRYKERFGDCNVPDNYEENPQLGTWVGKQRALRNAGKLSAGREARLDALGFIWDARTSNWEAMLAQLRQHRRENGHCDVPARCKKNPELAQWVQEQRHQQNTGRMAEDRKAQLDELGFVWAPHEVAWESNFGELKKFHEENGHCNVPQGWAGNPQLASWVAIQRMGKRKGRLSPEQEAKLNSLAFVWDPHEAAWQNMVSELKLFHAEHGHCNISDDSKLGRWVRKQRQNRNKLSPAHVAQLQELGFTWDPHDALWEQMYVELEQYSHEHGNCNVSARSKTHVQLGTWVNNQRALYRRGKLSLTRKARLDALGFDWNPQANKRRAG